MQGSAFRMNVLAQSDLIPQLFVMGKPRDLIMSWERGSDKLLTIHESPQSNIIIISARLFIYPL